MNRKVAAPFLAVVFLTWNIALAHEASPGHLGVVKLYFLNPERPAFSAETPFSPYEKARIYLNEEFVGDALPRLGGDHKPEFRLPPGTNTLRVESESGGRFESKFTVVGSGSTQWIVVDLRKSETEQEQAADPDVATQPLSSEPARQLTSDPQQVLLPLIVKRNQLAAEYHKRHPKVLLLDEQIAERQKKLMEIEAAWLANVDVTGMNDRDLRRTVQQLLNRVIQLEREVSELEEQRSETAIR